MTTVEVQEYLLVNAGVSRTAIRKIMEVLSDAIVQGLRVDREVQLVGLGKISVVGKEIVFVPDANVKGRVI